MSPQFIAMGIAMFYSLGIIEQVAMADDLNASLLSLGSVARFFLVERQPGSGSRRAYLTLSAA